LLLFLRLSEYFSPFLYLSIASGCNAKTNRRRFFLFNYFISLQCFRVKLSSTEIRAAVQAALAEDIGSGDATTLATVPSTLTARAVMRAREPLVVCGLEFAEAAFRELSRKIKIQKVLRDGQSAKAGAALLKISGPAAPILTAERVALNFIQRLSGVATLTSKFVRAVRGTGAQILDTRKTTPGWRRFEKYAVTCGGGKNYRIGLFDMVLIKDNHLAALRNEKPNAIAAAIARARKKFPKLKVEVETDTLDQVREALEAGAEIILLDNMSLAELRHAVKMVDGRAKTEASGGVNLKTVRAIAQTGVDFISVGALTHSAPAVDIGLDFEA
jgi:nicotinate-nucleotide pyrophosphorylase (carboxylating)